MSTFTADEKVKILTDIVAIKSVNDHELEVAQYFKGLFDQHNIDAKIIELGGSRANLVATIGSGHPVIGVSGHMDVVSAGNEADWLYDPFTLTEADGMLYGRGTSDMKAGLAALAIAMIDIKEQGLLKKGTIKLFATAGEESSQLGSNDFNQKGYMDDVEAMIIAEPSGNVINYANKGSMNFHITSRGVSSHSSMPNMGVNAIKPLLAFIEKVMAEFETTNESINYGSFDFTSIIENFGGEAGNDKKNKELTELLNGAVLTNTIVNGGSQINSVPDFAEAFFNARTVTEFGNHQMKEIFNAVLEEYKDTADLELEMLLDLDPAITSGQNSLVDLAKHIGEEKLDVEYKVGPTTGVTDASNLLLNKDVNFPFVVFGPGQTSTVHKVDEHVAKDNYLTFIDIYVALLTKYVEQ